MSGGFLSRWARLKAEAQAPDLSSDPAAPDLAPEVADQPEASAVPAVPEDAAPAEAAAEEEAFDPADLPDVESLTAESDYSVFMDARVPEDLRNSALRKLWTSDPVYAVRDGLNDYDEDYRTATLVGSAVRTIYDAVRGYAPAEEEPEQDVLVEDAEGGAPDASQAQVDEVAVSDDDSEISETAGRDSKNA